MIELLNKFEQALLILDRSAARKILTDAGSRMSSIQIVEKIISTALERIGEGWEQGSVSLSQVYMSGRICEELVGAILPQDASTRKDHPEMAITVLEDYHLLGKRIVYSILRTNGFKVKDFGQTEVDGLVHRVKDDKVRILLISTLMLPSALKVKEVRKKLVQLGLDTRIVVGGAPFRFDTGLWQDVEADAAAKTASESVGIINKIIGGLS